MNTKLLMTVTALLLGLTGLALSFLPGELQHYAGLGASKPLQLFIQLLGAPYFAFAMLNWMARGSTIGGIYNRPIAIANFTHFFVGAAALMKGIMNHRDLPNIIWVLAVCYLMFALFFLIILTRQPASRSKS